MVIADIAWYVWLILGMILIICEALTPGFYTLWIGIAALVTGFVKLIFPQMDFLVAAVIFTVFAIAISLLGKVFVYKKDSNTSGKTVNQRTSEYVGGKYLVVEKIVGGKGKVKIGDTIWTVKSSKEAEIGEYVTITGTDGSVLLA